MLHDPLVRPTVGHQLLDVPYRIVREDRPRMVFTRVPIPLAFGDLCRVFLGRTHTQMVGVAARPVVTRVHGLFTTRFEFMAVNQMDDEAMNALDPKRLGQSVTGQLPVTVFGFAALPLVTAIF